MNRCKQCGGQMKFCPSPSYDIDDKYCITHAAPGSICLSAAGYEHPHTGAAVLIDRWNKANPEQKT